MSAIPQTISSNSPTLIQNETGHASLSQTSTDKHRHQFIFYTSKKKSLICLLILTKVSFKKKKEEEERKREVECPLQSAGLWGNAGYCCMLWREHTGIWCKRFWHWTTEQLYWQVLQLTGDTTPLFFSLQQPPKASRDDIWFTVNLSCTLWSCHNVTGERPNYSILSKLTQGASNHSCNKTL